MAVWRVAVPTPGEAAAAVATEALATQCEVAGSFEAAVGWVAEGWSATRPDMALLESLLALIESSGPLTIERVAERNWVAENQASFPPVAAGRFIVHGSHLTAPLPPGRIGILIDAATAFGTGEHASTRGCLLAFDALARRPRRGRALDMGCGTGVLAIAAAKRWRRPVAARDNDPEAVRVATRNVRCNQVARFVTVRVSDGYRDPRLGRGRFDLVFANILARPLTLMAKDLRRVLAPGGVAVLSGLLARQEAQVLAAHRLQRLRLVRRIAIDGWHTLVVARASGRAE